jgi:hypothetical protein
MGAKPTHGLPARVAADGRSVLREMKRQLGERGWCRGRFRGEGQDTSIDLAYALAIAGEGRPAAERAAARAVLEAEIRQQIGEQRNRGLLSAWNDGQCSGLEDALALIDRGIVHIDTAGQVPAVMEGKYPGCLHDLQPAELEGRRDR